MINIDEFKKVEIKIGKILSAEKVPETDKLLKLSVDFGEEAPRQIISGISLYFPDLSILVGKKCAFCTNLEPRTIKGFESNGMICAVSGQKPPAEGSSEGENYFSLLEVSDNVPPGAQIK